MQGIEICRVRWPLLLLNYSWTVRLHATYAKRAVCVEPGLAESAAPPGSSQEVFNKLREHNLINVLNYCVQTLPLK